ncbi:MAG: hypothetical protein CMM01_06280 [Rhodopirellula sp.]|nr:hypothetical protein [Rhodopirellula sp.]
MASAMRLCLHDMVPEIAVLRNLTFRPGAGTTVTKTARKTGLSSPRQFHRLIRRQQPIGIHNHPSGLEYASQPFASQTSFSNRHRTQTDKLAPSLLKTDPTSPCEKQARS